MPHRRAIAIRLLSREREGKQSTARGDHDELSTVQHVGDGRGENRGAELDVPEVLPRMRVEGNEVSVGVPRER